MVELWPRLRSCVSGPSLFTFIRAALMPRRICEEEEKIAVSVGVIFMAGTLYGVQVMEQFY